MRGSGQLHLFAVTSVGTRKFKPNHWVSNGSYILAYFHLKIKKNKIK